MNLGSGLQHVDGMADCTAAESDPLRQHTLRQPPGRLTSPARNGLIVRDGAGAESRPAPQTDHSSGGNWNTSEKCTCGASPESAGPPDDIASRSSQTGCERSRTAVLGELRGEVLGLSRRCATRGILVCVRASQQGHAAPIAWGRQLRRKSGGNSVCSAGVGKGGGPSDLKPA
jgi:hypothetical protein